MLWFLFITLGCGQINDVSILNEDEFFVFSRIENLIGESKKYCSYLVDIIDNPYEPTSNNKYYEDEPLIPQPKDYLVDMGLEERKSATATFSNCSAAINNKISYYCLDNKNIFDIIVLLKINFQHNLTQTQIAILEDMIEKHLAVPGFTVDIQFKNVSYNLVTSNENEYLNSRNWNYNYLTMAHETMHLLGAKDEYDWLFNHASNRGLKRLYRLRVMLGIVENHPFIGKNGIMVRSQDKPLHRHVCDIAKLNKDCIIKRKGFFHE